MKTAEEHLRELQQAATAGQRCSPHHFIRPPDRLGEQISLEGTLSNFVFQTGVMYLKGDKIYIHRSIYLPERSKVTLIAIQPNGHSDSLIWSVELEEREA